MKDNVDGCGVLFEIMNEENGWNAVVALTKIRPRMNGDRAIVVVQIRLSLELGSFLVDRPIVDRDRIVEQAAIVKEHPSKCKIEYHVSVFLH